MLYQGQDLKLAQGKEVWTDRWDGPELVKYIRHAACCGHVFKRLPDEGEDSVIQCRKSPDGREFVCADTREELLLHAISQQKATIADAQAEIERLQGLREVRDEPEPEVHFWVGFLEPVKRAFYKSSIRSKLLWCGDRTSASKMIGYHGKNISIHYVEGWEELNDVDFIRAQVVNLRMANVVTEFIVQP